MQWDRPIWIIGNGPSSSTLDRARVQWYDGRVLVINKGMFHYPADAFFSLDRNFVKEYAQAIEDFDGEKHIALTGKRPDIKGVHWYDWSHADGLSDDPSKLCTGCNSGYAAIGLAYTHGAKEIHLIGYDMDPKDNSQYQFWAKAFDTMVPQLKARGVKVYNHNIHSHVTAFEKVL